jgi:FAD/FMN-containing dehydrogenase
LRAVSTALGQEPGRDASYYPNYAIYGTPAEQIWGSNLPLLRKFKKVYDPKNVMGLAGGFKVQ